MVPPPRSVEGRNPNARPSPPREEACGRGPASAIFPFMAVLAEPRVERYGKIVRIPPGPGRVIVSTDLHGHMEDYRRVVAAFERALSRGNAYLVFTGDLVHGPAYERDHYPEHLGDYYEDETPLLIQSFIELQKKHRSRVICLMGNHEHSHVGGPHTRKFHKE